MVLGPVRPDATLCLVIFLMGDIPYETKRSGKPKLRIRVNIERIRAEIKSGSNFKTPEKNNTNPRQKVSFF